MVDSGTGKILVIGLGNLMLSDLGAGIEVIHALRRRRPRPAGIDLVRAGIVNISLGGVIVHYRGLIMVTAYDFDAQPGTIREHARSAMDRCMAHLDGQDPAVVDIFALLRDEDMMPQQRVLLAVQPAVVQVGRGLSRALQQAVEPLADRVVALAGTMAAAGCSPVAAISGH